MIKFSVLFNTASDWVKAAAAAVTAGAAAYTAGAVDGHVSPADWVTVASGAAVALIAALGLYHSNDASTVAAPGKVGTEVATADPVAQTVEYVAPQIPPIAEAQPDVAADIPPLS